jgi:hypothetical protein
LYKSHSYELQTIHRQSSDTVFLSLLNHLRFGYLTAEELQLLNNDCYQRKLNNNVKNGNDGVVEEEVILPTQIYTHK